MMKEVLMKYQVRRVKNLAINRCQACDKRMHIIWNKKSIFEVFPVNKDGERLTGMSVFVCSNTCANLVVLQDRHYEIYGY